MKIETEAANALTIKGEKIELRIVDVGDYIRIKVPEGSKVEAFAFNEIAIRKGEQ